MKDSLNIMKNKSFLSITLSLALSFLTFSCSSNLDSNIELTQNDFIAQNTNVKKAKWTIMVYMSGDNNLEEYIVKDLEKELGKIGSTSNVQIVALSDRITGYDKTRGDWKGTKLFHVTKGMKANSENAVSDLGEKSMGSPKTLTDFVSWSKSNYPAENYALYFWGHGWSWHKGFTMEDKTNHDSLDPNEIKNVFDKLGKIDMVAYDACNMGSIEVESLWYKHAKAIVHSQEFVGGDGIEYDQVLTKLNANPNLKAEDLAIITNKSAATNKEKTGSAVILDAKFVNLIKAVDEWSIALKNGLDTNRKNYEKSFSKAQKFIELPDDNDLYDLASKISENVSDPIIKSKSTAVMSAVKSVILDEWHIKKYANAHGITISKVKANDKEKKYYKTLDFSKNTNWDEFLDLYKN